jgi:hypothetical protein
VFEGATADGFETTLSTVDPTADRTILLPDASDTLVGKATTDTLTNKSISLTNNTVTFTSLELKTGCSDETGSGALVFATSPTLVTPVLGTPSSGTLTNCTGLPVSGITASTSTALGVGSIELGHATDTTIARSSAGVVTIEGNTILTSGSTSASVQFGSFGVGTAASGTTGEIRATNAITSFYSDERLKTDITEISGAVDKVMQLRGVTFRANELAESYGYVSNKEQVGVIAQDVEKVLPQIVFHAPFDIMQLQEGVEISRSGENYKTVHYEKLVPLLILAIKEQQLMIEELQKKVG